MKQCFKCGEWLPKTDFYKHPQTADGLLNKCKSCAKTLSRKNRKNNIEHYRNYDIERGCRVLPEKTKEWRERFPNKYKAETMVGNAVRDKKLFKKPCELCGNKKTHAHHDDYLQPLNVRWLCVVHHREWHDKNGQGKNG